MIAGWRLKRETQIDFRILFFHYVCELLLKVEEEKLDILAKRREFKIFLTAFILCAYIKKKNFQTCAFTLQRGVTSHYRRRFANLHCTAVITY